MRSGEGDGTAAAILFPPLAANAVRCFPKHNQRFLHRLPINSTHGTRLRLARTLSGEHPYRVLTVILGHLGKLIQDHLLAPDPLLDNAV